MISFVSYDKPYLWVFAAALNHQEEILQKNSNAGWGDGSIDEALAEQA